MQYVGTDANGVETYSVTSANNGPDSGTLRVLRPTHPAAGVAHNFLYALPVGPLQDTSFGDPMTTLESLDAQDQYNLTVIVPSFGTEPWYADNPLDPSEQYETFMAAELQPWVKANLSTTGLEQTLADRVLEVGHRRPGSPPEAPRPVHARRVVGLPGRHVDV